MTDTITPESLRALAANLGLIEVTLRDEGFDHHAGRVQASAKAMYAAADEIERLKHPTITIQGAAEMLEDGTICKEPVVIGDEVWVFGEPSHD